MVNIFGVRPTGKFPRTNGNSGRFPFSQNVRKFRLGKKWKTFRRFVPLGNSRKSGKFKKASPVPIGTFPTEFRVPFTRFLYFIPV